MVDTIYLYDDPVLGQVSCDTQEQAISLAEKHNTQALAQDWENGECVREWEIHS